MAIPCDDGIPRGRDATQNHVHSKENRHRIAPVTILLRSYVTALVRSICSRCVPQRILLMTPLRLSSAVFLT